MLDLDKSTDEKPWVSGKPVISLISTRRYNIRMRELEQLFLFCKSLAPLFKENSVVEEGWEENWLFSLKKGR